ncbi:MAG: alpha/beta hydrolase [Pseudomonadaceae bacterium]|nr:alpha/beta hydrolase [Pseudomonadaceae bacterium]
MRHQKSAARYLLAGAGLLLLLLVSAACSSLTALNAVLPDRYAAKHLALPYGTATRQKLDVYLPDAVESSKTASHKLTTVVFFYGGAWTSGDRLDYEFIASALTEAGFIAVIPDYRLHPEVVFPGFVDDAAAAVCWVLKNIDQYGGRTDHVAVMGHSAGAHIASLIHYDESHLARHCPGTGQSAAFIGLAGPYDFLPLVSPTMQAIFPEKTRNDSQPVNFVDGNEGPALLMHGMLDVRAKPRNSAALAEQIRQAGGAVDLKIYDKQEHIDVLLAFATPLRWIAPVFTDTRSFLQDTFNVPVQDIQRAAD